MKRLCKRMISLVVALALLISMTPLSAMAATPITKHDLSFGSSVWYDLYYKNGSIWESWGSYYANLVDYFDFDDGSTGYCIEPFNPTPSVGSDRTTINWYDIETKWSGGFEIEKQAGITLALAYGSPNNGNTSAAAKFATALVVWDMATGYRNADGTLRMGVTPPFAQAIKASHADVYAEYEAILARISKHGTIPSFSAEYASQTTGAQTHTLTYNSATGLYETTLTDENGVLESFNYQSTITGLSFAKNGNTLSITATAEAAAQLSGGVMFTTRGNQIEVGPDSVLVWTSNNGSDVQLICTLEAETDPVPSYFALTANVAGNIQIVKETNTGEDRAGWYFDVWDASWNQIGRFITGSDGTVTIPDLPAGQYIVREVWGPNWGSEYWSSDTKDYSVTVSAGATTTHTVTNTHYGKMQLVKQTNTGEDRAGWYFDVWDASWNQIGRFATGSDGTVTIPNLTPGEYIVREVWGPNWGNEYWSCDTKDYRVTVSAGATTTHTITNTHYGKLKIIKQTNTGDNLDGWEFGLFSDEGCNNLITTLTSDQSGLAQTHLEPGVYWVKETAGPGFDSEYWSCDTEPQRIEVEAGEDTSVSFTNTYFGKLLVRKEMATDGPLEGWQFKITSLSDNADMGIFTSQEDGTILSGNLLPGDYLVEELISEDSLYYCKSENPVTVTVTAGATVEVAFTNALRPGQMTIEKVNHSGEHLPGAKFLLEWSEDGTSWNPVAFSDKEDVVKGGSTTEGLTDGCLTTDSTGTITFAGLYPGLHYRLTELEAPEGYALLADYAFLGALPAETLEISLQVTNGQRIVLPETGSTGTGFVTGSVLLAGVALITLMVLVFTTPKLAVNMNTKIQKRKEKKV